jgi:hypothetical protein
MKSGSGQPIGERYSFIDLTQEPEIHLYVVGRGDQFPDFSVEILCDPKWRARHQIERVGGVWMPAGDPEFVFEADGRSFKPSARQRRAGNLDRHGLRIEQLLDQGFEQDDTVWRGKAAWYKRLAKDWRITRPRSRRGRRGTIDTDEVQRLRCDGHSYREIEKLTGAKAKSAANKVSKNKRRTPM